MISNRDILIVGQQPWDTETGSNCKNIALEFSKHNRVLYVNAPLDRITRLRYGNDAKVKTRLEVVHGKTNGIVKIKDNLWNLYPETIIESINWIKIDAIHNFFNYLNNKKFAKAIAKAIEDLELKDFILFNDGDMFRSFHLDELLKPSISVYYSRDYLLATDYYKSHGPRLEPQLIEKSTVCVANSSFLKDYCKKFNPNSFYVGQGCDQPETNPSAGIKTPADIADIKAPIIGYVGALLISRLDIQLIINIAKFRSDWQVVLVGPEDEAFKQSELHHLSNVHFLGSKAPEDLPAYIQAFDVCINPQTVNMLTMGNYPRKVDEYLIMGKPVVATRTTAMDIFEDYTYLVDAVDDYPHRISQALREDTLQKRQQRRAFAKTHTWENSVNEIYKAIETVTKKNDNVEEHLEKSA